MGDKSEIVWTDATWNPIAGCTQVDKDCTNCYAMQSVTRMAGAPNYGSRYAGLTRPSPRGPVWTGKVALIREMLDRPIRWTKPRLVFVNSLSDLFHPDVPVEWIDEIFAIMALAPRHVYQLLTKRPARAAEYLSDPLMAPRVVKIMLRYVDENPTLGLDRERTLTGPPWPWLHLGTSIGHQEAITRGHELLACRPYAPVLWVSAGPLIGRTSLAEILPRPCPNRSLSGARCVQHADRTTTSAVLIPCARCGGTGRLDGIDWVAGEGESGRMARPCHPDWARLLRDECQAAGVPFLWKQWGEWLPGEVRWETDADGDERLHTYHQDESGPDGHQGLPDYWWTPVHTSTHPDGPADGLVSTRVGKRPAGRLLDGRIWDEYPTAHPANL